ncbi:MAG: oligosaccharide flippase family protein [Saprospiraceae bacterium]
MNREFLINIIFLVAINLLIKPFYIFGIDRTIQNTVAAGEYGIYFALFNFTFLLQIINDFGIQNFNSRNIAQHRQLLEKYFPNILILKSILAVFYLAAVMLFATLLGYTELYFHLLLFISLNWILNSLILLFRSNISGLAMYRTDSLVSILDRLLLIFVCGYLLWFSPARDDFRIEWFIYAQTATLFVTASVAFFIVYGRLKYLHFRFQPAFLLVIVKNSYPYALVIFLMTIYSRIDAIMIERLLPNGKIEADLYASAYRLLEASNMIGFLFASLLLPMFARMLKAREPLEDLVYFSWQMIWAGAITLAVSVFFFQTEIMELLYDSGSAYSGEILGYLMLSFIAVTGSYIFGTLLTANGNVRQLNIIAFVTVAVNVVFNYFFILKSQALGAAQVTCITQFFALVAQLFFIKKIFDLKVEIGVIIRLLVFGIVVWVGSYFHYQMGYVEWEWRFLVNVILASGVAFLLRLIDVGGLVGMLKNR